MKKIFERMVMKGIVCSYSCFQKKSKYVSIACGGYLGMQQNLYFNDNYYCETHKTINTRNIILWNALVLRGQSQ